LRNAILPKLSEIYDEIWQNINEILSVEKDVLFPADRD
jgi:hypothetical protein